MDITLSFRLVNCQSYRSHLLSTAPSSVSTPLVSNCNELGTISARGTIERRRFDRDMGHSEYTESSELQEDFSLSQSKRSRVFELQQIFIFELFARKYFCTL